MHCGTSTCGLSLLGCLALRSRPPWFGFPVFVGVALGFPAGVFCQAFLVVRFFYRLLSLHGPLSISLWVAANEVEMSCLALGPSACLFLLFILILVVVLFESPWGGSRPPLRTHVSSGALLPILLLLLLLSVSLSVPPCVSPLLSSLFSSVLLVWFGLFVKEMACPASPRTWLPATVVLSAGMAPSSLPWTWLTDVVVFVAVCWGFVVTSLLHTRVHTQNQPQEMKSASEARSYAEAHDLGATIHEMFQRMLRDQPLLPYTFMASFLGDKAVEHKDGGAHLGGFGHHCTWLCGVGASQDMTRLFLLAGLVFIVRVQCTCPLGRVWCQGSYFSSAFFY